MVARKKGLVVWCLLLGGKELDGWRGGGTAATAAGGGGGVAAPRANDGGRLGRQMVGAAMGD